jgi:hypothetical protein
MSDTTAGKHAFTIDEFGFRNGIGRDTTYKEIKFGRLIARKVGKKTLILDVDEARWRASLRQLDVADRQKWRVRRKDDAAEAAAA